MQHYTRPARTKHNLEFAALMHLRMGCLLSKEPQLMDDAEVKSRAEKLLTLLRENHPSLQFNSSFIFKAGRLGETIGMQISQDLSRCTLFRLNTENVVRLPVQLRVVGAAQ